MANPASAHAPGASRTVESFFSRKPTEKDGGRGRRALAIQQAIDARGSGARKALQKYKLANDLIPPHSNPSGAAFDDYHVSAAHTSSENQGEAVARVMNEESSGNNEEKEIQKRRHEAWQKRLHAPSGLVPRRRSLNLDEAEAREARAALAEARGEEYQPEADDAATPVDGTDDSADIEVISESARGSRAKSTRAGGSRAVRGRGKKKEDVGPSGLSYTPLEKQVSLRISRRQGGRLLTYDAWQFMEIKAANPDVLLLVEGESYFEYYHKDMYANSS